MLPLRYNAVVFMNTVRFFLLLLSLFFFAFLFRASPSPRLQEHEVLSENTSVISGASLLFYPGSVILLRTDTHALYETTDAVGIVTKWYRKNFQLSVRSDVTGSSAGKVVLQGYSGKSAYTVSVKKNGTTSRTRIDVMINAT